MAVAKLAESLTLVPNTMKKGIRWNEKMLIFPKSKENRILIQIYITFYDWYMLSRTIERNFHAFITLENISRWDWDTKFIHESWEN